MSKIKNLSIRVSESVYNQIEQMAKEKNMSKSELIRKGLGIKDDTKDTKKVSIKLDVDVLREMEAQAQKQGMSLEEYLASKLSSRY